ncbi:MAG TPA: cupin domain-containing protein [Armatimonadota bacterium]
MNPEYLYYPDLAEQVDVPSGGIISRTLSNDDHAKVVLFGFDTGQELSEHTSSMPAIIQVVSGEAELILGSDKMDARAGSWAFMQPELKHGIVAKSPLVMILTMLKRSA